MKSEIRQFITAALRFRANVDRDEARAIAEHRAQFAERVGPEVMEAFADDLAELDAAAAPPSPGFTPEERVAKFPERRP